MKSFKPVFVEARDLDEGWFKLCYELHKHGRVYEVSEGSRKGTTRLSFDDVAGVIHNPYSPNLAPIVPPSVVPPTTHAYIEEYFANYLMNGQVEGNEDYKYGTFLVGGEYRVGLQTNLGESIMVKTPDQIAWIINHFKHAGFGNAHCFVTVGYPESNRHYDLEYANESERKTSPCLRGLDFKIIKEDDRFYLTMKVIYRSWDLWAGWPTNMGGFTLLNAYVAGELRICPGPITFTCKDLHCYASEIDQLKFRLGE